ncbi:MAG: hypothetical protein OWU33_04565 [Firmicutes bacterium]|nr:hypothetical protein [Bacillota bacterium]
MRVIWWKITRPDTGVGPVELMGDTLNIHLPEEWSLQDILQQNGDQPVDRDWLNRLLAWSDGLPPSTPRK